MLESFPSSKVLPRRIFINFVAHLCSRDTPRLEMWNEFAGIAQAEPQNEGSNDLPLDIMPLPSGGNVHRLQGEPYWIATHRVDVHMQAECVKRIRQQWKHHFSTVRICVSCTGYSHMRCNCDSQSEVSCKREQRKLFAQPPPSATSACLSSPVTSISHH
jgi:hypothetical protein